MNTTAAPAASGRTFLRVVVAAWAVITAASVIIFALRVNSVVRWSHLFSTTGEEAPGIYAIWKVVNVHPAYEWPDRENYSIALYNCGFYHFYGGVLRLLGKNGGQLLPAGR